VSNHRSYQSILTHHGQVDKAREKLLWNKLARQQSFEKRRKLIQDEVLLWQVCEVVIVMAWLSSIISLSITGLRGVF